MKALKITGCQDERLWYAQFVGMVVPYYGFEDGTFWSREVAGYKNIVKKEDGEVVEVSLTQPFYKAINLD